VGKTGQEEAKELVTICTARHKQVHTENMSMKEAPRRRVTGRVKQ
jgi:hypothetical protein